MAFKFEKLRVWHLALDLSDQVFELIQVFPKEERFGLSAQIMRAADSVSLNIAEGSIGQTNREQQRFLGYSIRSCGEVVNCLYLAKRRKYIPDSRFREVYDFIDSLIQKLQAFRNSLN